MKKLKDFGLMEPGLVLVIFDICIGTGVLFLIRAAFYLIIILEVICFIMTLTVCVIGTNYKSYRYYRVQTHMTRSVQIFDTMPIAVVVFFISVFTAVKLGMGDELKNMKSWLFLIVIFVLGATLMSFLIKVAAIDREPKKAQHLDKEVVEGVYRNDKANPDKAIISRKMSGAVKISGSEDMSGSMKIAGSIKVSKPKEEHERDNTCIQCMERITRLIYYVYVSLMVHFFIYMITTLILISLFPVRFPYGLA